MSTIKRNAKRSNFKKNAIHNSGCIHNLEKNKPGICDQCRADVKQMEEIEEMEDYYELRDKFNRGELR